MCHRAVGRFKCAPTSVRASRAFVVDQLSNWGISPADSAYASVADATLVTSELVANAIRFCVDAVKLSLVTHRDQIEIAVTDDNPQLARMQHPGPASTSGRGLIIVDTLAAGWGQVRHDRGKTVWARLALPVGSILADGCTL
jgi:anti-sigma regulatory factor (Ser/Thr protein kinase)